MSALKQLEGGDMEECRRSLHRPRCRRRVSTFIKGPGGPAAKALFNIESPGPLLVKLGRSIRTRYRCLKNVLRNPNEHNHCS